MAKKKGGSPLDAIREIARHDIAAGHSVTGFRINPQWLLELLDDHETMINVRKVKAERARNYRHAKKGLAH